MELEPTLAATAVSIVVPYVTKGAEEFVKGAGKDAYEKTKDLFGYLKQGSPETKKLAVRSLCSRRTRVVTGRRWRAFCEKKWKRMSTSRPNYQII